MSDEFDLIGLIIAALGDAATGPGVVVGPGDDAAVVEVPKAHQLVVSTDTLVADRHYPAGACADAIGYRSLAVATSDLAAMGAEPAYATVSLVIERLTRGWAKRYANGLAWAARDFGIAIVGGNVARGPQSITVTVHGHVPAGHAITRSGGKPGDRVYVTGTLGGAGLALGDEGLGECSLDALIHDSPLGRYWMPQPRIALGIALRGVASAAIDISDGLSSDLAHLCRASRTGCDAELSSVPVFAGAQPLDAAAAGDDYELAFASAADPSAIENLARQAGVPATPIATLHEGSDSAVRWFDHGVPVQVREGFRHF